MRPHNRSATRMISASVVSASRHGRAQSRSEAALAAQLEALFSKLQLFRLTFSKTRSNTHLWAATVRATRVRASTGVEPV